MHLGVRPAVLVIAAMVAAPLFVSNGYDSFPLSTYPMFARDRPRVAPVYTVVVRDPTGATRRLSSNLISGTGEPMLAMETAHRAIIDGAADALCDEVAERAAREDIKGIVEVVTEWYDSRDWFAGEHVPIDRRVHATCEVAT